MGRDRKHLAFSPCVTIIQVTVTKYRNVILSLWDPRHKVESVAAGLVYSYFPIFSPSSVAWRFYPVPTIQPCFVPIAFIVFIGWLVNDLTLYWWSAETASFSSLGRHLLLVYQRFQRPTYSNQKSHCQQWCNNILAFLKLSYNIFQQGKQS